MAKNLLASIIFISIVVILFGILETMIGIKWTTTIMLAFIMNAYAVAGDNKCQKK